MLQAAFTTHRIEAGVDEVGRGCLAGPVVAAAVILPRHFQNEMLTDSKKLTAAQRDTLRYVIEAQAVSYAIAEASPAEIDQINILNASFLAMHRALEQLQPQPELILVDGNRFTPYGHTPHKCIVKGDGVFMAIAAASILAKTYRDHLMRQLADQYPEYGWQTNAGYPTKAHRAAIQKFGITPWHRKSFRLLPEQIHLDFNVGD
ncbi:MAG: ribonuclease HII [Gemmatimonadetes bacterium]|nr:MAG: ribonuclease HII [Gemmatimonadota bacterium]